MPDAIYIGKAGRSPLATIAAKSSERIRSSTAAWAVCMDPKGRVTLEPVADAVPGEIVGTYTRALGWPALDRLIEGDLLAEVRERRAA